MAVKIVRQPNKIALLGAPTSAAAMSAGHEGAPAALRAAGLAGRLREIGYDVTDLGDDPVQLFQPDERKSSSAKSFARDRFAGSAEAARGNSREIFGALPLILSRRLLGCAGHRGGRATLFPQRQHDLHGSATRI